MVVYTGNVEPTFTNDVTTREALSGGVTTVKVYPTSHHAARLRTTLKIKHVCPPHPVLVEWSLSMED